MDLLRRADLGERHDTQLFVADTGLRDHGLCKCLNLVRPVAEDHRFNTAVMIKVGVHRRDRERKVLVRSLRSTSRNASDRLL